MNVTNIRYNDKHARKERVKGEKETGGTLKYRNDSESTFTYLAQTHAHKHTHTHTCTRLLKTQCLNSPEPPPRVCSWKCSPRYTVWTYTHLRVWQEQWAECGEPRARGGSLWHTRSLGILITHTHLNSSYCTSVTHTFPTDCCLSTSRYSDGKKKRPNLDQIGGTVETFLSRQDYLAMECEKTASLSRNTQSITFFDCVCVCLFEFKYPEQGKGFRGAGVHMCLFCFLSFESQPSCPVFCFDLAFMYENPISFYHRSMRPLERAKQLFGSCGQRDWQKIINWIQRGNIQVLRGVSQYLGPH